MYTSAPNPLRYLPVNGDPTRVQFPATNPDGADVYVDDQFYGNSPAILKLKPGKHMILVKMSGYKDWSKDISTDAGAEAHLTAALERSN